jgi:hypothetical protein
VWTEGHTCVCVRAVCVGARRTSTLDEPTGERVQSWQRRGRGRGGFCRVCRTYREGFPGWFASVRNDAVSFASAVSMSPAVNASSTSAARPTSASVAPPSKI